MASQTGNMGLVIHAKVAYVGENTILPSGTFRDQEHNREYGFWRGSRMKPLRNNLALHVDFDGSGVSGSNIVVPAVVGSGYTVGGGDIADGCAAYTPGLFTWGGSSWSQTGTNACDYQAGCDSIEPSSSGSSPGETQIGTCESTGGTAGGTSQVTSAGSARWYKAGALDADLGIDAPQQRSVFLGSDGFINFGSGVTSQNQEFTVLATVIPSGNPSDVTIVSSHEKDPAQFVLGVDGLGRYYVRSDAYEEKKYVPKFAKSVKSVREYDFPTMVVGTFESGALRLYINGKNEGFSDSFERSTKDYQVSQLMLGKSDLVVDNSNFVGWVEEFGYAPTGWKPKDVKDYYDSVFNLGEFIREDAPPTSGAFTAEEFDGPSFYAFDSDYIEFVAKSGEGAYDQGAWKQHEYAISSDILFTLQNIRPNLFSLTNNITVEAWVENNTTHSSGVNLYAEINNYGFEDSKSSVNWYSDSYVYLPSGGKTKVTFTGTVPESSDVIGSSYRDHLQRNKLKLTVHYPEQNDPHDTEFRIYSTKIKYESFETFNHANTSNFTFMTEGGSYTSHNETMPLFMDVALATQTMPLMLNPEPATSLGNTGGSSFSGIGSILQNKTMPLFISAGSISSHLNLFLDVGSFTTEDATMSLFTQGGELVMPYLRNTIPLYMEGDQARGLLNSDLFLSIPNVGAASIAATKTLFMAGKNFNTNMPLVTFGPDTTFSDQYLYLKAPDNSTHNEERFTLYLKQRKDFSGSSSMGGTGSVLINSDSDLRLYMSGLVRSSGTMPLFMPSGVGTITNNLPLNIRGFL